ncbi:hypothetical protein KCU61_g243, partial [Aureobasidium melanogenum]
MEILARPFLRCLAKLYISTSTISSHIAICTLVSVHSLPVLQATWMQNSAADMSCNLFAAKHSSKALRLDPVSHMSRSRAYESPLNRFDLISGCSLDGRFCPLMKKPNLASFIFGVGVLSRDGWRMGVACSRCASGRFLDRVCSHSSLILRRHTARHTARELSESSDTAASENYTVSTIIMLIRLESIYSGVLIDFGNVILPCEFRVERPLCSTTKLCETKDVISPATLSNCKSVGETPVSTLLGEEQSGSFDLTAKETKVTDMLRRCCIESMAKLVMNSFVSEVICLHVLSQLWTWAVHIVEYLTRSCPDLSCKVIFAVRARLQLNSFELLRRMSSSICDALEISDCCSRSELAGLVVRLCDTSVLGSPAAPRKRLLVASMLRSFRRFASREGGGTGRKLWFSICGIRLPAGESLDGLLRLSFHVAFWLPPIVFVQDTGLNVAVVLVARLAKQLDRGEVNAKLTRQLWKPLALL